MPAREGSPVALRRPGADPAAGRIDAARPLGLYVHYPFCSVRCPYCDFAIDTRAAIPQGRYTDAVVAEIAGRAPWFRPAGRPGEAGALVSIYFGGGTPGLWPAPHVARVIETARAALAPTALDMEITLEGNPSELDERQLAGLREAGVNRISLGIQSFDDDLLRAIGRNHDGAAAAAGYRRVRAAGFARVSCDLMFGLPGQTRAQLDRSIDELVALAPEHVSCYGLTIERGTPFGSLARAGKLPMPADDAMAALYQRVQERLAAAGYVQYEVSSFARAGARAVHNQLYWSQGAYLGVGCSAASFRPLGDGTAWRFSNPRATDTYLRRAAEGAGSPAPASVERRSAGALEAEAFWLALRTSDGANRRAHEMRHGRDPLAPDGRAAEAERLVGLGWLQVSPERVALTPRGFLFADEVAVRLCF